MSAHALAWQLDSDLPRTFADQVTIDQVAVILGGVTNDQAKRAIAYHRRRIGNSAEALLCYRGVWGCGYWMSHDPDEIADYGAEQYRGMHTRNETQLRHAERAVRFASAGSKARRIARQRRTDIEQLALLIERLVV